MNEIKVGQWARYKKKKQFIDDEGFLNQAKYEEEYFIGEIKSIYKNIIQFKNSNCIDNEIIKTTDNLVDLLEVGDIVHYYYNNHFTDEIDSAVTIIEIEHDINFIKNREATITVIELHENRVKQVIE